MNNSGQNVTPTCDYCDKPPTYAFMDGERICSQCLGRFPTTQGAHRLRIRELEVLLEAADALADAVQVVIHAQTNFTIDIVGLDKMKAQHKALLAYRKLAQPDAARPAGMTS